MIEQLLAM